MGVIRGLYSKAPHRGHFGRFLDGFGRAQRLQYYSDCRNADTGQRAMRRAAYIQEGNHLFLPNLLSCSKCLPREAQRAMIVPTHGTWISGRSYNSPPRILSLRRPHAIRTRYTAVSSRRLPSNWQTAPLLSSRCYGPHGPVPNIKA